MRSRHLQRHALATLLVAVLMAAASPARGDAAPIKVVTTLSGYAAIAKMVGGDKVVTDYFVKGYQDPHFVRPKPSLATKLPDADLFVSTGLDLELWAPALVDMSGNERIRSGQEAYVSASHGIDLLQKPTVMSRSEGGVHIYGNPHLQNSPVNGKFVARNIVTGLKKVDPANGVYYDERLAAFVQTLNERLFGAELVGLVGGPMLTRLALSDGLIPFLRQNQYQGTPLLDRLGGWMKRALPFRGRKIIGYHKNWAYFTQLFGLEMVDFVEPKPGIPPTPKHVAQLIEKMKKNRIRVIVAANYFDEDQVRTIAGRVGAEVAYVALDVGGYPAIDGYFELFDHLVGEIAAAYERAEKKQ